VISFKVHGTSTLQTNRQTTGRTDGQHNGGNTARLALRATRRKTRAHRCFTSIMRHEK